MSIKMLLAVLLAGVSVMGCQSNPDAEVPPPLIEPIDPIANPAAAMKEQAKHTSVVTELHSIKTDLHYLIGLAEADDISQCRVVATGHKPCGGPAEYLAYSTKTANEAAILNTAKAYSVAAEAENKRLARVSDCAVVPEPEVILQNGKCTLVKE